MKKVNINKLLRNIFLVLAIILLCLKIVGRVSAEEMSNDDISYLENIFKECDNYNDAVPYLEWVYANFPYYYYWHSENQDYFCFYHVPDFYIGHAVHDTKIVDGVEKLDYYVRSDYSFIGSQDRWIYSYFRNSISGVSVSNPWYTNTFDDDICSVCIYVAHFNGDYLDDPFNSMAIGFYGFDTSGNPSSQTCTVYSPDNINEVVDSNVTYMSHSYVNSNWAQTILNTSKNAGYRSPFGYIGHSYNPDRYFFSNVKYAYWNDLTGYNGVETPTEFICNYDCKYMIDSRLFNPYVYQFEKNIVYPDDSNTFGFNCYSTIKYGELYLVADFSNLISISADVENSSDISITYNVDGVETILQYNSLSDYYEYSVSDHIARYLIPYTVFGDLSENNVVSVNKIQVVNTAGNEVKTFKYFTPIYIKNISEYENTEVLPLTDKTVEYEQVMNTEDFTNYSGTFHNDTNFPSWADTFTIVIYGNYYDPSVNTIPLSYDWAVYFQDFTQFNFYGYVDPTFISPGNAQVDYYENLRFNKTDIDKCLYMYGLMESCDIVRIIVGDFNITGTTWTTTQDMVFYMQNYYNKLSIMGIGNLQSAVESGSYYTKGIYNLLNTKLVEMNNNQISFFRSSGNYLFSTVNLLGSINDTLNDGFNDLTSAISSAGSSSYDLNALSDKLQYLFVPSLTWESIDFNDYLDSMGVLALPFEFTNDILTTARSNYSSTLDLHINDFVVPLGSDVGSFTVFEDQDYSFNPLSIFPRNGWELLQYLNAFAVIIGESWFTYCHIFRRSKSDS